jgi:hypothetical protein
LTDRIGIGVLTRSFPPALVDEVIEGLGRREQRSRSLPARLVVYYVLAMALFASDGYEEVMRRLVQGLAWTARWGGGWQVPSSPAISKARARLGPQVMAALFDRVAVPVAGAGTAGAFYRRWRLVAVDGTTFDVPDEVSNTRRFGKPSNDQGEGAFPQVRVVAVAECGTHAVFGAAMDGVGVGEQDLLRRLWGKLTPGMLVIADRNFLGYELWQAAAGTGAELLWRAKSDLRLPVVAELPDGSYLSYLVAPGTRRRGERIEVRVIEYTFRHRSPSTRTRPGRSTGWSPRSATPTPPAPTTSPRPMLNAGRSSRSSTRSRPTNSTPAPCCAPVTPTACTKRSGASSASTTRSVT